MTINLYMALAASGAYGPRGGLRPMTCHSSGTMSSRIQFSAYSPSCSFLSVASRVRTVSGVQVSAFSPKKSRRHFVIHVMEQSNSGILFAQPVSEGDGTIKDGVPIAVAE